MVYYDEGNEKSVCFEEFVSIKWLVFYVKFESNKWVGEGGSDIDNYKYVEFECMVENEGL